MVLAREIAASTLVDDVMRKWPPTIRAFLDHRMNCPGCPIACFHTVADACKEHHVDMEVFLRDLQALAAEAS
jgi:hybrid cluster-associated redox disulfide protein